MGIEIGDLEVSLRLNCDGPGCYDQRLGSSPNANALQFSDEEVVNYVNEECYPDSDPWLFVDDDETYCPACAKHNKQDDEDKEVTCSYRNCKNIIDVSDPYERKLEACKDCLKAAYPCPYCGYDHAGGSCKDPGQCFRN